jgi:hypothetical protein
MKSLYTLIFLTFLTAIPAFSQLTINSPGTISITGDPLAPAISDMDVSLYPANLKKGLLIPRVQLTGTGDITTIAVPTISTPIPTSLLVYNIGAAGTFPNNVTAGFYFWNGTVWERFITSSAISFEWLLTGNSNCTTDFVNNRLGTLNSMPLNFIENGDRAGRIDHINRNAFFGHFAGRLIEHPKQNVAIGEQALYTEADNTDYATNNVAVGFQSLFLNSHSNANATDGIQNTAIGSMSLHENNTGKDNTAAGFKALYNNRVSDNTAVGSMALFSNSTGTFNTATGSQALVSNQTGNENTAIGFYALWSNKASDNTATGGFALVQNNLGNDNTATGDSTLFSNQSGNFNTATGADALLSNISGNENTANGYMALGRNTNASQNVAIGNEALSNQTYIGTGNYLTDNVAVGYKAMWMNNPTSNTNGYQNTAIGSQALYSNITGSHNTAEGYDALYYNTSGNENTATGSRALYKNSTGIRNVATGDGALITNTAGYRNVAVGSFALMVNLIGHDNTAIGLDALPHSLGNENIGIGTNSGLDIFNGNNIIVIGSNLQGVDVSNTTYMGNIWGTLVSPGVNLPVSPNVLQVFVNSDGQLGTEPAAGSFQSDDWLLVGNDFSNSNIDVNSYLGTWAGVNFPLQFKVNGLRSGLLDWDNTNSTANTFFGFSAGISTTGGQNTANGYDALFTNTTGFGNSAIGYQALYNNTQGSYNVATGYQSLWSNNTGLGNIAYGPQSLYFNTSGYYNSALGNSALYSNQTGWGNVAAGISSLVANTTGNLNNAFGTEALKNSIDGSENISIGYKSGLAIEHSSGMICIGSQILGDDIGNHTYIANIYPTTVTGRLVYVDANGMLGTNTAAVHSDDWLLVGNDFSNSNIDVNSYLGTWAGVNFPLQFKVNGVRSGLIDWESTPSTGNTFFGFSAGIATTGTSAGCKNFAAGYEALFTNTTGNFNSATGYYALYYNNGDQNVADGYNALFYHSTGEGNVGIGGQAIYYNEHGSVNTALGKMSLYNALGDSNIAIGVHSGYAVTSLATHNVICIGSNLAGRDISYRTYISNIYATPVTTGVNGGGGTVLSVVINSDGQLGTIAIPGTGLDENWKVGGNIAPFSNIIGNDASLGNLDVHAGASTRIFIDGTSGNVGIGTIIPAQKLEVIGNIKTDAVYGNGSLFIQGSLPIATLAETGSITLTTTATNYPAGDVVIQGGKSSITYGANAGAKIMVKGWGFPGLDEGSNIILQLGNSWGGDRFLKINDETGNTRMTVVSSGNVGIGTIAPTAKLEVIGKVKITDGTEGVGRILTSDANGLASWSTPSSGSTDWHITGNAGTVAGTNFVGTTDNVALDFRVNNVISGRIDSYGAVYLGYKAGNVANSSGSHNTGIGYQALFSNTTGNYNTANGYDALYLNTTGSSNTANGWVALQSNTIGEKNTANGDGSLEHNDIGNQNTANGTASLISNTTGNDNTADGYDALSNNITGKQNTALGSQACTSWTNLINATAIGYGTYVSTSDKVRLGNSSITVVEGQVDYTFPSDARFKENIKDDIQGLEFILKLQPVSYNFNRLSFARFIKEKTEGRESQLQELSKIRSSGFLAQDVEKTIKQIGFDAFDAVHAPANENDNYGLSYAHFVVPLVKAVQEQQAIINNQDIKANDLQSQVDELKTMLEKLTLQFITLKAENVNLKTSLVDVKTEIQKLSAKIDALTNNKLSSK